MARIILGATMVRQPLGGLHLWVLSWLLGFQRLGHQVFLVEKSGWPGSCYDVSKRVMTDDCAYGVGVVAGLLRRFGLDQNWCFIDASGRYHGLSRERVESVFRSGDLFVDLEGTEWQEEAADVPVRVMIDAEPGWYRSGWKTAEPSARNPPAITITTPSAPTSERSGRRPRLEVRHGDTFYRPSFSILPLIPEWMSTGRSRQ